MRQVLLDTNAYVAFKQGEANAIEIIRYVEKITISIIVLGELLSGFELGSRNAENRGELNAFLNSPRVSILSLGERTANFYAKVFLQLKQKGKPIPTNDIWVAATALEYGQSIYTNDHHFDAIDSLSVGKHINDFLP